MSGFDLMKRYHLFEWEDQPWLSATLRDYLTDHLRFALGSDQALPLHRAISQVLFRVMQRSGVRDIVDLCSGGGGPLLAVQRVLKTEMNFETAVTLTDLYPNAAAFEHAESSSGGKVRSHSEPVSALDVPAHLTGVRTLFTAFHHFRPDEATRILMDARVKRRAITIFEPFERSLVMACLLGIAGILCGLFFTPKLGRMSLSRFALTYLAPVAPMVTAWDGVVSALRSYTVSELLELASHAGDCDFIWEAGQVPVPTPIGSLPLTYLVGLPV